MEARHLLRSSSTRISPPPSCNFAAENRKGRASTGSNTARDISSQQGSLQARRVGPSPSPESSLDCSRRIPAFPQATFQTLCLQSDDGRSLPSRRRLKAAKVRWSQSAQPLPPLSIRVASLIPALGPRRDLAMSPAICEVNHQANDEPSDESNPCDHSESRHQSAAQNNRNHREPRNKWHSESAFPIRLIPPQMDYAQRNQHKCE